MRDFIHLVALTVVQLLMIREFDAVSAGPLHLTPFLQEGDIERARNLSGVTGLVPAVPESYAGFITVDKELGNHLFFWFFPSTSDSNAPLVVWLNGGPTVSSMVGLLWENGPIRVKRSADGIVTYESWGKTWVGPFSMLYIDSPVGTGYSYTESDDAGYRFTQDGYSSDLHSFMEQFYQLFPEYLMRELYTGGQSYAGKYVSTLAHRIHREIQAGNSRIPLTGIYLGGPYFDPRTQNYAAFEYFHAIGAISDVQMQKMKNDVSNLFQRLDRGELQNASLSEVNPVLFPDKGINAEDNIVTLEYPPDSEINALMRSESFRSALHVGNLTYEAYNRNKLVSRYVLDLLSSAKSKLATLMDNYKVLVFTGELDALTNPAMVDAALKSTPWSHQAQFNNSERSVWRVENRLNGFYTQVGQFCRVTIHGGGHSTPHDQPDSTLEMMMQFVQYGCIRD